MPAVARIGTAGPDGRPRQSGRSCSSRRAPARAAAGSSSDGGTTIEPSSHGYTDAEAKALDSQVAQWNKAHPTTKVKLRLQRRQRQRAAEDGCRIHRGNYPDVAYEFGSSAAQLVRQPKLIDLTDKVKAPGVNWIDFYPSERQAATVNGKVVGVPGTRRQPQPRLQQEALRGCRCRAADERPGRGQDFRAAAKKLTDAGTHTYGWAYVNDGSEDTVWRFLAMLWQAGGDLLTPDNNKPAFDSSAGLAALQQLHDMAVTDKSVYLDTGNGNYLNLFNSGKIAMLWTGPVGSVEHQLRRLTTASRYLPGYNGDHETISGPDLYMALRPLVRAQRTRH